MTRVMIHNHESNADHKRDAGNSGDNDSKSDNKNGICDNDRLSAL